MTIDSLFEQLKHPNPNMRGRAMQELANNHDESLILRLMANLEDEDIVYRRASVKTLGVIGVNAVPHIVKVLLSSDNPTVKASCTKALAQVSANHPEIDFPQEGIEGLKTAVEDPNPVVYIPAVMALGQIGSPVIELLIDIVKTQKMDNLAVAIAAINALGSIGDPRAVGVLKELAEDESVDTYVRESATSALPRLDMVMKYKNLGS